MGALPCTGTGSGHCHADAELVDGSSPRYCLSCARAEEPGPDAKKADPEVIAVEETVFDGTWIRIRDGFDIGEIRSGSIRWARYAVDPTPVFAHVGGEQLVMNLEGSSHVGRLKGETLVWSDGDSWRRIRR
mmetsp:Transcript_92415/g.198110  ORF Transcript_92415/g.198110 Transcript_92415/m.198110 type:complete len:131 (+) Transcript_92415:40-432(+)